VTGESLKSYTPQAVRHLISNAGALNPRKRRSEMKNISSVLAIFFLFAIQGAFASGSMSPQELNTDRPGSDISNFDMEKADPRQCQAQCASNAACKAWTYVKPNTIQGPLPRCWLKNAIPQATQNTCCVSGIKGKIGHNID
jgi:hypothetical protein